jgi:hypothetical protein
MINFIKSDLDKNIQGKRKYILTPTVVCIDDGQKFFFNGEEYLYPGAAKKAITAEFNSENLDEENEVNDKTKQAYKESVIFDMLEPTPKESRIFADSEDNDSVFGIPEIKRFKWFEACLGKIPEGELSSNDKMAINRYEYLARTILKYRK